MTANLSGLPIFYETFDPERPTAFDFGLDEWAKADALARRTLAGFCNLTGDETEFVIHTDNLREDIVSPVSHTINRHRQVVCALSLTLFEHPHASLEEIAAHLNRRRLKVYLAEAHSPFYRFLRRHLEPDLLVCSEYFGDAHRSGELVGGVLHQDLQRTSFADATFDLVLTFEVFEHVPDAPAAEREVLRILKEGGVHCFTVPFTPDADEDIVLAELGEGGEVRHHAEPQYHGDPMRPDEGILVYRIFSHRGMKRRFDELGCEFKTYRLWSKALGILDSNGWVHTVRKARPGEDGDAPLSLDEQLARLAATATGPQKEQVTRLAAAVTALQAELNGALESLAETRARAERGEEALRWIRSSPEGRLTSAARHALQFSEPALSVRRLLEQGGDFRGVIESPAEGASCAGVLEVVGWAVSHGSRVTTAEAFLDGSYLGPLVYGAGRPDVAAAGHAAGAAPGCGYAGRFELGYEKPGARVLAVRVFDERGRQHVYTRRFTLRRQNA